MLEQMLSIVLVLATLHVSMTFGQTTFPCNASAPCGCSGSPAVTSRILGGEVAVNSSWGWTVTVLLNNSFFCSGVIISQSWVLSSAGCIGFFRPFEILVSAASNVFFAWKQWRQAVAIFPHPNFTSNTMVNDLILIQLSSPFNMTDPGIARICLPDAIADDYPPVNSSVVAVGWGPTVQNGPPSTLLQQVTLQRVAFNTFGCNQSSITNPAVQICATAANGSRGVCPGDGGGPVMMYTPSSQWVLVGVISYSFGCLNHGFPSIMTRMTSAVSWIRSMNISDLFTPNNIIPTTTTTITTVSTTSSTTATTPTSMSTTSATTTTSVTTTSVSTTSATTTTVSTTTSTTRTTSTTSTTTSVTTTTATSTTSRTTTTTTVTTVTTATESSTSPSTTSQLATASSSTNTAAGHLSKSSVSIPVTTAVFLLLHLLS